MHHAIPKTITELNALRQFPASEELVAVAIAGVITLARSHGQSLDDVIIAILKEDGLLDYVQRDRLSDMVSQAWQMLPNLPSALPTATPSAPVPPSGPHNTDAVMAPFH
ncbi:MAG: hypothetical protein RLZZ568_1586 [Cyanobacteriota bacterium]